jgi:hypothetical protein
MHGDFMNVGQLRVLKQNIYSSKVENKIHEKETIFLIVKMTDKDFLYYSLINGIVEPMSKDLVEMFSIELA